MYRILFRVPNSLGLIFKPQGCLTCLKPKMELYIWCDKFQQTDSSTRTCVREQSSLIGRYWMRWLSHDQKLCSFSVTPGGSHAPPTLTSTCRGSERLATPLYLSVSFTRTPNTSNTYFPFAFV